MSRRRTQRLLLLAVGAVALLAIIPPTFHLVRTAYLDRTVVEKLPAGYADDVSRLNKTQVAEIWDIPSDPQKGEDELRELLLKAQATHLHVSIAGARHSMGGQTIYPGGIAVNMLPFKGMKLDEDKNLLHVQAGAKWADVIPYLDQHGRSVAVMQSDNSFTVGGSLSVNCHGWQYGRPPIASTVESFHLMKADGSVIACSRAQNRELFSLVLGGYGLFGVILDADLRVVPNQRLRLEQYVVPLGRAMESFARTLRKTPDVELVYARLNITPQKMFDEVLINVFYRESGPIPQLTASGSRWLPRLIFRGSAGSTYGKEMRWAAETHIQAELTGKVFSRNQLMNDNAEWYLDRSEGTTDILHEYFVDRDHAGEFLGAARKIIRKHNEDLLNVTVRDVKTDSDTFLNYAHNDILAFVMFFSQPRSAAGDAEMQAMTIELVDAALAAGGRYYLPYRLHATPAQFHRAYPQADEFFNLKRRYDPQELFQNQFYRKYGKQLADQSIERR
ncbi:MAG: linked oxidase domain protein [Acidobacteriaceae bacterium]|nr:linked oxidase domain protein [Acidobacteriaceae bacterium]